MAADQKHFPLVDLFILRGADPNLAEAASGQLALHRSSFDGLFEIVERLFEGGADVNLTRIFQARSILNLSSQDR